MSIPTWLTDIAQGLGAAAGGGVLGRALYHANAVRQGRRKPFSLALVWELPIAVGMGVIGEGVAQAAGFSGKPATAVIVILAYLGPRGAEEILRRWLDRRVNTSA